MSRGIKTVAKTATATIGVPKPGLRSVPKPGPRRKPVSQPVVSGDKISSGDKHLEWVRMGQMRISESAQRTHNTPSSLKKIAEIRDMFDPDKFGTLTVNLRDGFFYIIDGGHRYHGVREWFGDG